MFFNTNLMQPGIAEVVFVEKPFACAKTKSGKKHLFRVVGETNPAIVVNAIVLAMDVEPIQMDITSANSNLNRIMEIGHLAVTTNEQSPPNHRTNPLEPYLQLINMGLPELWHNPSFLASISYIGLTAKILEQRQINLVSLRENIDTSTVTGRCFLSMMGAIHQMERELRAERAAAGRSSAKARGRTGGRPKTDPAKLENARILYENSDKTAAEVCEIAGVGRRTFFAHIAAKRNELAKLEIS